MEEMNNLNSNINRICTQSISIVHWNCRSIMMKKDELLQLAYETDVLVYVETWLKPNKNLEIPGFNAVRKDRINQRGGGIVIFIVKHLSYKILENIVIADQNVESCSGKHSLRK